MKLSDQIEKKIENRGESKPHFGEN